jgi:hypothetical protein
MLPLHRTEMVLAEEGKLTLEQLPFPIGQAVEVIVIPRQSLTSASASLHGSVLRYDNPTEPVAIEDWSALQ